MLGGETALVTGGGGGIGREIAAQLKAAGANVAICGRNVEKLEAAAHAIGGALTLPGDLLDDTYVQSCVDRTVETFGGLDILIEDFDRVMATNVRAPFILIRSALPQLRKARGRVINIASVVAHKGYPLQSAYAASKHALLGLSKSLANELYEDGVRVHVISPGGVYTDMAKVARPDLSPDGLISAAEVADAVMFLLSLDKNAVIDEICLHRQGKAPFA